MLVRSAAEAVGISARSSLWRTEALKSAVSVNIWRQGLCQNSGEPSTPAASTADQSARFPWTPTRFLRKRKVYKKRMGWLLQTLEKEQVAQAKSSTEIPSFRSGDILEVTVMVPENQRKQYTYKGVCIARYNKGIRTSFKIYNVFPDAGGVTQHFPLYMPDLVDIKVVGSVKRHTAKLYPWTRDASERHRYQSSPTMRSG